MFQALKAHHTRVADRSILSLFDAARAGDFSLRACGMLFDWSKTNIDAEGRRLLLDLCDKAGLAEKREAMFTGARINQTEGRAVLHTALRAPPEAKILVDGTDVVPEVVATRRRMAAFAGRLRSGEIRTPAGQTFTDVVNIGIGGSDLGPAMGYIALAPYADGPRCHFVSNVDGAQIADTLKGLPPETTLVIVASKTFTTIETMTNAATARDWLAAGVGRDQVGGHLCALSSNLAATAQWGIDPARVFGFEDWVGGRYSMWGPIGLSLMLAVGPENFRAFCMGAGEMDTHFRQAPPEANMPVLLALTGIWHNQVCGYATRAVLPYEQRLARLPAYLQQLEMESNGKRVAMDGSTLAFDSGPVVWGEPGTNGQHAFYQLIHQGTRPIPCEFMVGRRGHEPDLTHQHRLLVANCLAQSEALLRGRSLDEATAIMAKKGLTGEELDRQARHRVFPGNRPSTTLVYDLLDPATLGRIVALYEHRVFVEGVILGINSFDQWGVELGKELATALGPVLEGKVGTEGKDGSTAMLVAELKG